MTRRTTLAFVVSAGIGASAATLGADAMRLEWERTFGGARDDAGSCVRQTSDGGYVVAGTTDSDGAGGSDVYLLRADAEGGKVWSAVFGGQGGDGGKAVREVGNGGLVVVGWTDSWGAGGEDVYVVKTDGEGREEWSATFGGDKDEQGYAVVEARDGGIVVCGWTESLGSGGSDAFLLKTDAEGNELWLRTYGGRGNEQARSVDAIVEGGYYVAGYSEAATGGEASVYLVRVDDDGSPLWSRSYGGSGSDWGRSVVQTSGGGCIIAGFTTSFGGGAADVYLTRVGPDGGALWSRAFGGPSDDWGRSVAELDNGAYVIAATTLSFGKGAEDAYVIEVDPDGEQVGVWAFGGEGSDFGDSVAATRDGGCVVAGASVSSGAGGKDVYLLKLGPQPQALVRGDADADGITNVTDAICVLSYLFGPEDEGCAPVVAECLDAADTSDDGNLDITDAVRILRFLFLGSPLPGPVGACGLDETPDDLGCSAFVACGA